MTRKWLLIVPLSLIVLGIGGYGYLNHRVQSLVDERIAAFIADGDYRALDYESVSLTLTGDIVIENLHVIDNSGNEYILEHIRVTDVDYFNDTPHHLLLTASGMRFPAGVPAFGDPPARIWRAYLENALQSGRLPLEISYRYDYQPDDNARLDNRVSVFLPEAFQLDTASTIHNLTLGGTNGGGAPATDPYTALINNTDIPSATLAFRDMGLVQDMLAIQGQDFGLDSDQYRQQLLAQLQTMVLFTPRQLQGMAQDYLGRLADFLQGEKTLRISIKPEYGGDLQQLQSEIQGALFTGNFSRIRDLLHLEVDTLP